MEFQRRAVRGLCPAQAHQCAFFRLLQDVREIGVQLLYGVGIAGMEGHGNHGTHLGQVYLDYAVIISHFPGSQLPVVAFAPVDFIEVLNLLVCLPD